MGIKRRNSGSEVSVSDRLARIEESLSEIRRSESIARTRVSALAESEAAARKHAAQQDDYCRYLYARMRRMAIRVVNLREALARANECLATPGSRVVAIRCRENAISGDPASFMAKLNELLDE